MLGFIIVGIKRRQKDYGPVYPLQCGRCGNQPLHRVAKIRRWGHLFWIPIIPLESWYLLYCPICSDATELEDDEAADAKRAAEKLQAYNEGNLSASEVEPAVEEFKASVLVDRDDVVFFDNEALLEGVDQESE